jgi:hypothetical protein
MLEGTFTDRNTKYKTSHKNCDRLIREWRGNISNNIEIFIYYRVCNYNVIVNF